LVVASGARPVHRLRGAAGHRPAVPPDRPAAGAEHQIEAQTALLREQNEKLDQQTVTAEAQRRGALSTELFALLQMASELPPDDAARRRAFAARAVAFTRAATPFYYVRVEAGREASTPYGAGASSRGVLRGRANGRAKPELIEHPLSPERGQLLQGLVAAGADLAPLIEAQATFAEADLRGADLSGATLSRATLFRADLSQANLSGATPRDADLSQAVLSGTDLTNASLVGADLSGAYLSQAEFRGAIVSTGELEPGRLPSGFPRGWEGPPPGWGLVRDDYMHGPVRLQRSGTQPPAPPAPSR
jgi:hypothetical protein